MLLWLCGKNIFEEVEEEWRPIWRSFPLFRRRSDSGRRFHQPRTGGEESEWIVECLGTSDLQLKTSGGILAVRKNHMRELWSDFSEICRDIWILQWRISSDILSAQWLVGILFCREISLSCWLAWKFLLGIKHFFFKKDTLMGSWEEEMRHWSQPVNKSKVH